MTPAEFARWRQLMGFNRSEAAEALYLSRNMPQRYEEGLTPIPGYIGLACACLIRGIPPWPG
jgi:transcriptional regulator with XRE-family HTH domain